MKTNPQAHSRGFTDKTDLTNEEIEKKQTMVESAHNNIQLTTNIKKPAT